MNTHVNFEIAKSLKEKGYHQLNTGLYYTKDKEHCLVGWGFNDRTEESFAKYSAPTIAEVVMWLYEKHGVWVGVIPYNDEELSQTLWENKVIHISDNYNDCSDYTFYHSPTEAYEAAITYVLNNLI